MPAFPPSVGHSPVARLCKLAHSPLTLYRAGSFGRRARTHLSKDPSVPHRILSAPLPLVQYSNRRRCGPLESPGAPMEAREAREERGARPEGTGNLTMPRG
jgi:hypothetical protein